MGLVISYLRSRQRSSVAPREPGSPFFETDIVKVRRNFYVDTLQLYSWDRSKVHSDVLRRLDEAGFGNCRVYLCGHSPDIIHQPDWDSGNFEIIPVLAYTRAMADHNFDPDMYDWTYDPYALVPLPPSLAPSLA